MKKRVYQTAKQKEVTRFKIILAKIFQNLAYMSLFCGLAIFVYVTTWLIFNYWLQSEPGLVSSSSQTEFGAFGWIGLMFKLSTGFMIFAEVIFGILAVILFIWCWRLVVRGMRRLTWRLADEILKPLGLVEPIFLLIVWALNIIGIWFFMGQNNFWALALTSLILLIVGEACFLLMRKLVSDQLDYSRAELVLGRR